MEPGDRPSLPFERVKNPAVRWGLDTHKSGVFLQSNAAVKNLMFIDTRDQCPPRLMVQPKGATKVLEICRPARDASNAVVRYLSVIWLPARSLSMAP